MLCTLSSVLPPPPPPPVPWVRSTLSKSNFVSCSSLEMSTLSCMPNTSGICTAGRAYRQQTTIPSWYPIPSDMSINPEDVETRRIQMFQRIFVEIIAQMFSLMTKCKAGVCVYKWSTKCPVILGNQCTYINNAMTPLAKSDDEFDYDVEKMWQTGFLAKNHTTPIYTDHRASHYTQLLSLITEQHTTSSCCH